MSILSPLHPHEKTLNLQNFSYPPSYSDELLRREVIGAHLFLAPSAARLVLRVPWEEKKHLMEDHLQLMAVNRVV